MSLAVGGEDTGPYRSALGTQTHEQNGFPSHVGTYFILSNLANNKKIKDKATEANQFADYALAKKLKKMRRSSCAENLTTYLVCTTSVRHSSFPIEMGMYQVQVQTLSM
jgi:hypothetical protein